ncbi:hypothetical protein GJ744_005809 [Endocarpon pusillum]|uniref:TMEM205-like domain-containing protein n=1 Tax=Endocarpon pusillum TaxID=364733 RepID=A0A8H7ABZ4_9EURO|nr:hypothetical protein GJ744_005809 [Endocarpon pusillum]
MAAILNAVAHIAPYHLMAYGTLLGTELYQSFVMTKICYQALPMAQFTTLQKKVFPAYFRIQVALIALTAATFPTKSVVSLARAGWVFWVPLGTNFGMAALNWLVYGPRTQDMMIKRSHQETIDARKYNDGENTSEDMRRIKRDFSRNHAMAIHLNLIAIGATIWYGFALASKIRFVL